MTVATRRARSGERWDTVIRTLNRDGKSPFNCLSGVMPVPETQGLKDHWWDYRLDLSMPKVGHVVYYHSQISFIVILQVEGASKNGMAIQYSVARGISEMLLGPESGFIPSGYGLKK